MGPALLPSCSRPRAVCRSAVSAAERVLVVVKFAGRCRRQARCSPGRRLVRAGLRLMVGGVSHDAPDRLGAEAAPGKEAHLTQALGGTGRRMPELALPDGAGAVEFAGMELAAKLWRRFGAMHSQLMLDAPVAEAPDAGVDATFDEAVIGQLPALLQLVEQRVDVSLRRGGRVRGRMGRRTAGQRGGAGDRFERLQPAQQLGAQFLARVLALRQVLERALAQ